MGTTGAGTGGGRSGVNPPLKVLSGVSRLAGGVAVFVVSGFGRLEEDWRGGDAGL